MNWRRLNVRITSDEFDSRISPAVVITIGTVGSIVGVSILLYTAAHNKNWLTVAVLIASIGIGIAIVRLRRRNYHS
jgi:fucose permease